VVLWPPAPIGDWNDMLRAGGKDEREGRGWRPDGQGAPRVGESSSPTPRHFSMSRVPSSRSRPPMCAGVPTPWKMPSSRRRSSFAGLFRSLSAYSSHPPITWPSSEPSHRSAKPALSCLYQSVDVRRG